MSNRGLDRERRLANQLGTDGWLVGSRRHIGGAGDLLVVRARPVDDWAPGVTVALIEVKSTTSPYAHFRRLDRLEMHKAASLANAQAYLCWWPKGTGQWVMYHESAWPRTKED